MLAGRSQVDEAIAHYQKALEIKPDFAEAYNNLALLRAEREGILETLAKRREAMRLQPNNAAFLNDTAEVLATNPNASVRNGTEAVELAERALKLSGGNEPAILGTLAAAYAEAGRFPEAAATAQSPRTCYATEQAGLGGHLAGPDRPVRSGKALSRSAAGSRTAATETLTHGSRPGN